MIKVLVKTNTMRQEVITEVTKTPAQVFEQADAGVAGAMVNLNRKIKIHKERTGYGLRKHYYYGFKC